MRCSFVHRLDLDMDIFAETLSKLDSAFRQLEAQVRSPIRVNKRGGFVFRYETHTPEIVVVQKLSRVLTGLRATLALLERGLYQEVGVMFRMLDEFREDISFMCDAVRNGNTSDLQKQFIEDFFQEEFDADNPFKATQSRRRVPRRKIQAMLARTIQQEPLNPSDSQEIFRTIANTNSGYVHGTSEHILDMCTGNPPRYRLDGMLGTHLQQTFEKTAQDYFYRAILSFNEAALSFQQTDLDRNLDQHKRMFEQLIGIPDLQSAKELIRLDRRRKK